jgi:threonine/homoserine/homoserine lactone efflux protein
MTPGVLLTFVGVVMIAYVVPGPDWVLILRHAARGRRAGFVSAAGVQCGLLVHMAVAAAGVSALLLHSAVAFTVLKVAGGAYLVYLGGRSLWQPRRRRIPGRPGEGPEAAERPAATRRTFAESFLANVLNPKAALFFLSVLPQFVSPDRPAVPQVLLLGGLDVALGVGWWAGFVLLTSRLSGLMGRERPRRVLDRVTGAVLVGIGGVLIIRT